MTARIHLVFGHLMLGALFVGAGGCSSNSSGPEGALTATGESTQAITESAAVAQGSCSRANAASMAATIEENYNQQGTRSALLVTLGEVVRNCSDPKYDILLLAHAENGDYVDSGLKNVSFRYRNPKGVSVWVFQAGTFEIKQHWDIDIRDGQMAFLGLATDELHARNPESPYPGSLELARQYASDEKDCAGEEQRAANICGPPRDQRIADKAQCDKAYTSKADACRATFNKCPANILAQCTTNMEECIKPATASWVSCKTAADEAYADAEKRFNDCMQPKREGTYMAYPICKMKVPPAAQKLTFK